jgi:hypothetical protein
MKSKCTNAKIQISLQRVCFMKLDIAFTSSELGALKFDIAFSEHRTESVCEESEDIKRHQIRGFFQEPS